MDPEFRFEIHHDGIGENIRFYGSIDSHAEQHFEELSARITARRVVMDFSNTVRINSTGIAFLLRSIRCITEERKSEVAIIGENDTCSLLFKKAGIYSLTTHTSPVGRQW
jgi:anti-anti-sigma regulatory factor